MHLLLFLLTFLSIEIGPHPFDLEIAKTQKEREKGLSHRSEVEESGGMLFVFSTSEKKAFYMRDCLVPIDLIFLDEKGAITDFYEMRVEPSTSIEKLTRYRSSKPIRYAIELKAKTIEKLHLQKGQKILSTTHIYFLNSLEEGDSK